MSTPLQVVGILGSVAAGAVAAILLSPKSGKVNRRFLAMKARTFSKKLTKKVETQNVS